MILEAGHDDEKELLLLLILTHFLFCMTSLILAEYSDGGSGWGICVVRAVVAANDALGMTMPNRWNLCLGGGSKVESYFIFIFCLWMENDQLEKLVKIGVSFKTYLTAPREVSEFFSSKSSFLRVRAPRNIHPNIISLPQDWIIAGSAAFGAESSLVTPSLWHHC